MIIMIIMIIIIIIIIIKQILLPKLFSKCYKICRYHILTYHRQAITEHIEIIHCHYL